MFASLDGRLNYNSFVGYAYFKTSSEFLSKFKMESEDAHMASETSEHTELQKTLKKKLMGPTILDSFTKLTSDAEKLRIGAGINLLKHLNAVDSIDKVRIVTCGL